MTKNSLLQLPPWKDTAISREFIGGLTTFFTMVYVVIVNPSILSAEGTEMSFARRKHPLALLAPIILLTIVAALTGQIKAPTSLVSAPDFSLFFQLDLWGSLKPALLPAMLSICLTDLFDSISTLVGVSNATGLVDETGEPKNLRRGFLLFV